MPYVQLDEYGLIDENSPCFDCENAYVEDIWYEWMCKAKECPYQKKDNAIPTNEKRKVVKRE